MQISDKKISEFQTMWEKRFNQRISTKEALEKGTQLVNLVSIICKSQIKKN